MNKFLENINEVETTPPNRLNMRYGKNTFEAEKHVRDVISTLFISCVRII